MIRHIVHRIILIVPMVLGISLMTFFVIKLSPGDVLTAKHSMNPNVSSADLEEVRKLYHLDEPVIIQYFLWLKRILVLDFGKSFTDDVAVMDKVLAALPATLYLNIMSLFLIIAVGIPLGVYQAIHSSTPFDRLSTLFVFVVFSIPSFWLALLLIHLFGFHLEWFPISGLYPWYAEEKSLWQKLVIVIRHSTLPVIATSLSGLAGISRYMRMNMLEVLGKEYIALARAKGLAPKRIYFHHALKNAILPIVTIIGLSIPGLISGSVIFESIFAWPGMGRLGYLAVMNFDIPVIMGVGVMASFLTILGTLMTDIAYTFFDPRVRLE